MGLSALTFFLYATGCLEVIMAALSLAKPQLAIAQGCRVSTNALAALQSLGGTIPRL